MKEKGTERYLRVGTTLYKIVSRPLMSGDFIEERRPWNYETLRQDHSKDFISTIEKYDGFCSVPDHVDYKPYVGLFLNQYEVNKGQTNRRRMFDRYRIFESYFWRATRIRFGLYTVALSKAFISLTHLAIGV